ncbi:hypothetical protein PLICRDRAFT_701566 [Plicaturopsis crispa FD-325 SS-3]|uniref:Uncharacterized protein n=1 Tax=Plicaturopsis crispa FD-325 SS-3 TaxID=944288 RepID=A0A0C9SRM9_PLICR|nr:hypothetical protein PLICRDRAFT_701566 [Plicaturopsis crispa FD-325 SS-3]
MDEDEDEDNIPDNYEDNIPDNYEDHIPDNYEFYLANDEHDIPDLLRFSRPRERLPSIFGDVCFTPLPSTLDLQPQPSHPHPPGCEWGRGD